MGGWDGEPVQEEKDTERGGGGGKGDVTGERLSLPARGVLALGANLHTLRTQFRGGLVDRATLTRQRSITTARHAGVLSP